MIRILITLALLLSTYHSQAVTMQQESLVTNLRTLNMTNPLGIESTPEFSWTIDSSEKGFRQTAYQISVTDLQGHEVWNSGRVASSSQSHIVYKGEPLAKEAKEAFNRRFWTGETYAHGNQAELGMPLYYGLVPEERRQQVAELLAEAVRKTDFRIKTGEIGLKPVLMSLAQYGHNDVVYQMARQTDYPSYGYWVSQGATTSPEYWDMTLSQNHCMMDHIEEWFYGELAGLRPTSPAFETFAIKPWVPADMDSLHITYRCPYGEIGFGWKTDGKNIIYSATIPVGTTATLTLPTNGKTKTVVRGPGQYVFKTKR